MSECCSAVLPAADEKRYASWLKELRELNAVVEYQPDTPDGFYLVPGSPAMAT
jgi:hypothetical protein